jgi:hypothetical protein
MHVGRKQVIRAVGLAIAVVVGGTGVSGCSTPKPPSARAAADRFIIAARHGDTKTMCDMLTDRSRKWLHGGCPALKDLWRDIITDPGHPASQAVKAAPPGSRGGLRLNQLNLDGDRAGGQVTAAFPSGGRYGALDLQRSDGKWYVDLFPQGRYTNVFDCQKERTQLISARDRFVSANHRMPKNVMELILAGTVPMRSLHVDLLPNGSVSAVHDCE